MTRVCLWEAVSKIHVIKISSVLVRLVPAQFKHHVRVEELARHLEVYSAGTVSAWLPFLFTGWFNGDDSKLIQRKGVRKIAGYLLAPCCLLPQLTCGAALERNEEYAECFPQCGLNLLLTHRATCFSHSYFCETDFSFKKTSKWHSPRFTSGIYDLEKNRFACYFPRFAAVPLSWR